MKKTNKIIAIPIQKVIETNEYQSLIYKWKDKYYSCYDCIFSLEEAIPQQLLLLSDEEIKEGDYAFDGVETFKCHKWDKLKLQSKDLILADFNNEVLERNRLNCKKVIASFPQLDDLPTFTKEFIKEWINNPVEEVEVEYEELYSISMYAYSNELRLKLTSNNEVICSIPSQDYRDNLEYEERNNPNYYKSHSDQVVTEMNDNKEIEEAAEIYYEDNKIDIKLAPRNGLLQIEIEQSFIQGAKSEAAKTFHTKGMYTEEEVKRLCSEAYVKSPDDYDNMIEYFEKWFDENKKK